MVTRLDVYVWTVLSVLILVANASVLLAVVKLYTELVKREDIRAIGKGP